MSSGDELGSYSQTTPFHQGVADQSRDRSSRAPRRAVAGPSTSKSSQGATTGKRKNAKHSPPPNEEESPDGAPVNETEMIDIASGGESDSQEVVAIPPPQTRKTAANGKMINGAAAAGTAGKGKGKVKANPPVRTSRKTAAPAVAVDEDVQMVDESDEEHLARHSSSSGANKRAKIVHSEHLERLQRKLERSQEETKRVSEQRDALSRQFKELLSIRKSELEETLADTREQYDITIQNLEAQNKELNAQLARVEPLARSGQTASLIFLTREAADEEKRELERQIEQWRDLVRGKDAVIAENEERQAEQERVERELRRDLALEIENSKNNRADPRGGVGHDPVLQEARVIRFYEDLTNLLVVGHRIEQVKPNTKGERVFKCVYTHGETTKALNFTLRLFEDHVEDEEGPDVIERVKYTPHSLENESEEFRQSLQFMSDPFTFEKSQLPIFFKTMESLLGGGQGGEGEADQPEDKGA